MMTKSQVDSRNKPRTILLTVLFSGLMLVTGLMGCGGGSDGPPPPLPDQDASGLYKDGTAQLNSGTLMLNDIRGFVHDNRVIMFSIQGHLLFDGQITNVTSDEFTASLDVYENGVKTQTGVAVTGNVLAQSKITGTISGTGSASGDFTLTFDPLYSRGATLPRIEATGFDTWDGAPSYSIDNTQILLNFNASGIYSGGNTQNPSCSYDNGVTTIPSSLINIFLLSNDVTDSNTCAIIGTGYTGFGAVIDGVSVDDTFLYAVTNGTNSVFAVLF